MIDPRASTLFDQANEEVRHQGAASLTAVRIWPTLSKFVDTDDRVAQRRFVAILTSYKILATAEERHPTRDVLKQARKLRRLVKKGDWDQVGNHVFEMAGTPDGRSAVTQFLVFARHSERFDKELADQPDMSLAATRLLSRIAEFSVENGNHRPALRARARLLRRLVWFFGVHSRKQNSANKVGGSFTVLDFLVEVNRGILNEIAASQRLQNTALWLPNITIAGSPDDDHKAKTEKLDRKRLSMALSKISKI